MTTTSVRERLRVVRLPAVGSGNPYQHELYDRLRRHGIDLLAEERITVRRLLRRRPGIDVVHFHWRVDRMYRIAEDGLLSGRERAHRAPVAALRLVRFALLLRLVRARGIRIAWTVHEPWTCRPDGPRLDHLAGRLLARCADVLMTHDEASAELTRSYLQPRRPVTVLPHPGYAEVMPPARAGARERVRAELGVADDHVLVLVFGLLRPEKQFELLLDALRQVEEPRLRVLVAGRARVDAVVTMLREGERQDDRLTLQVGWVDEQRAADLFAAADLSVLPRSFEWSGASPVLSLSLGVPVVAAALQSTSELLGPGAWYFEPGDVRSLAARLSEALAAGPDARAARGEAGRRHVGRWDFDDLAAATALELRGGAGFAPTPADASCAVA